MTQHSITEDFVIDMFIRGHVTPSLHTLIMNEINEVLGDELLDWSSDLDREAASDVIEEILEMFQQQGHVGQIRTKWHQCATCFDKVEGLSGPAHYLQISFTQKNFLAPTTYVFVFREVAKITDFKP